MLKLSKLTDYAAVVMAHIARTPDQLFTASDITASDIIDAIEGPFGMTECSQEDALCDLQATCGVSDNWQRVSLVIRQMLSSITLVQLAQDEPLQLNWFSGPSVDNPAVEKKQMEIPLVALSSD